MFVHKPPQQLREACILIPHCDHGHRAKDVERVKVGVVYTSNVRVGHHDMGQKLQVEQPPGKAPWKLHRAWCVHQLKIVFKVYVPHDARSVRW